MRIGLLSKRENSQLVCWHSFHSIRDRFIAYLHEVPFCLPHPSYRERFEGLQTECHILSKDTYKQLDATEVFIADLIACSTCFGHHYAHHQELKSIIQWLLPVVFRAVVFKLLVWCRFAGCLLVFTHTTNQEMHFIYMCNYIP